MNTEHEVTGAQMCETRAPLSKKLAALEHQVVDTVHGATNVAAQTVDIIKDAVHETVAIVKESLDLRLQMERRPWAILGGSMALGFVGGYLLFRRGATRPAANAWHLPAPLDTHASPSSRMEM
jgi:hypothetical protein